MNEPDPRRRRCKPRCWVAAAVIAILLIHGTRGSTLPAMGRWLDVGERDPENSDYVMLLNGDPETRPFEVADLYRRGKAGRVLITSVANPNPGLAPETHQVARMILIRCGVPDDRIDFLDSRCRSTYDEAVTLNRFMHQHPESTFIVVTNTYHTRRTRWVFRHVLGSGVSRVTFASAQTDAFHAGNWWKNEEGFVLYLAELLKSIFYCFRYGHGLAWMGAIIGLIAAGWFFHRRPAVAVTESA